MATQASVEQAASNTGLKAGTVFFSMSSEAEIPGRQRANIFHQLKAIRQNTSLEVKFITSKDAFMLISGADVTAQAPQVHYRFVSTDFRLSIRSKQVIDATVLAPEGWLPRTSWDFLFGGLH